jgi:kynurenine formamidase
MLCCGCVRRAALVAAWEAVATKAAVHGLPTAALIRTLPNDGSKRVKGYNGTNPPYFTAEAAVWLAGTGMKHVCVDLPSVDREVSTLPA